MLVEHFPSFPTNISGHVHLIEYICWPPNDTDVTKAAEEVPVKTYLCWISLGLVVPVNSNI